MFSMTVLNMSSVKYVEILSSIVLQIVGRTNLTTFMSITVAIVLTLLNIDYVILQLYLNKANLPHAGSGSTECSV